jgi:hypothetical protein
MKTQAELEATLNNKIQLHLIENLNLTLTQAYKSEGEVCYLNSPELRPEFRLTFTQRDISDYLYALRHNPDGNGTEILPVDTGRFWSLVQLGRDKRSH